MVGAWGLPEGLHKEMAPNKPKILILGHARHGKDTAAELLVRLCQEVHIDISFASSSEFAAEKVVYPTMPYYSNWQECYADRGNHRTHWFNMIRYYNKEDKTRLAKEILKENDIYVGMRNIEEFEACMEACMFNYVLWIDAFERVGLESINSLNIKKDPTSMHIIYNNTDEAGLTSSLRAFVYTFLVPMYSTTLQSPEQLPLLLD